MGRPTIISGALSPVLFLRHDSDASEPSHLPYITFAVHQQEASGLGRTHLYCKACKVSPRSTSEKGMASPKSMSRPLAVGPTGPQTSGCSGLSRHG